KLDPSGTFLHYAVCMGGSGDDTIFGLGVGPDNTVLVSGTTTSPDMPVYQAWQDTFSGGFDAFAARIAADGKGIHYSTYLGGANDDRALSLGVDPAGNAYIAGETASRDLNVTNAIQKLHAGGNWDGFVAKFTPSGKAVYASYFGGAGDDRCMGISPDPSGNATFVGATSSTNLPVQNPQSDKTAGRWDGFISQLDAGGVSLSFSSYVGGNENDFLHAVTVDAMRRVHVCGVTGSTNIPASNAVQTRFGGGRTDAITGSMPPSYRPGPELRLVPAGGQPHGPEYDFYMGKFEITAADFVRFLNDAQANTNNTRGAHMWFDNSGNAWFNPAMKREADELFTIANSRLMYEPDYPAGARYFVTPTVPPFGGSYSNHPASGISWYGAVKYCNWLTIDAGRGEDERCYYEGTNRLDWAPVTSSRTNWANGSFSMAERELWIRKKGYRLPMDNCYGRKSAPNPFNEFLKAAAWTGSTNSLYGFGRVTVEPGDANYLDDESRSFNDTLPVGFFNGSDHGGKYQTRTNANQYGIYDISGSVTEWLSDPGSTNGNDRASYGGSWMFDPQPLSARQYVEPHFTDRFRGFRVMTTYPAEQYTVIRIPYYLCLKGCGQSKKVAAEEEKKEEQGEGVKPGEGDVAAEGKTL
ncbi:MAG: hypothetical protein FJ224_13210, partial [Lentisphaerae bacterium]|nr:hypothetical protein [Lentisphaerota bacterium]